MILYKIRMQTKGGSRLRVWLKERGLNQSTFADMVGTRQSNISAWILGRPISLAMAIVVHRVTGIEVEAWNEPDLDALKRRVRKAA